MKFNNVDILLQRKQNVLLLDFKTLIPLNFLFPEFWHSKTIFQINTEPIIGMFELFKIIFYGNSKYSNKVQ